MAKIINLSHLLPEDITFELPGGKQYTVPGDPPLELILRIAELFERVGNAGDEETEAEVGLEVLRALDEEVLGLLRSRDETIESSPFGVLGVQHFVAELLKLYNFGVEEEEPSDEGGAEGPTKAAAKPRSKRSSGSRSSSTSSTSRRTTGGGSPGRSSRPGKR